MTCGERCSHWQGFGLSVLSLYIYIYLIIYISIYLYIYLYLYLYLYLLLLYIYTIYIYYIYIYLSISIYQSALETETARPWLSLSQIRSYQNLPATKDGLRRPPCCWATLVSCGHILFGSRDHVRKWSTGRSVVTFHLVSCSRRSQGSKMGLCALCRQPQLASANIVTYCHPVATL